MSAISPQSCVAHRDALGRGVNINTHLYWCLFLDCNSFNDGFFVRQVLRSSLATCIALLHGNVLSARVSLNMYFWSTPARVDDVGSIRLSFDDVATVQSTCVRMSELDMLPAL